jgi:two-component system capsular synthesis sensor histidine kinase RcsC
MNTQTFLPHSDIAGQHKSWTLLGGFDQIHELFVQNISHELRTPLALAMGYTELLQDDTFGELSLEQRNALDIVLRRSRQIELIVERVCILLSSKANMVALEQLNMQEIVSDVVAQFQPEFEQANVSLTYKAEANLPPILGDKNHLYHLVACLLDNALKFTPAHNWATVTVAAQGDLLTLTVADNGIGMSPAVIAAIQQGQRFFQADPSATRRYGGLGLGLTLVNTVVVTHMGRMEIESEPGRGSQFTIGLPIPRLQESADRTAVSSHPPHYILVVDDDPEVASVIQAALRRLPNCEVMVAHNAAEALDLCAHQQFDLLLTDYNMPGADGVSLVKQVRRQWPRALAIMITAHVSQELRRLATAAAIDHVLDKRVRIAEIQRVVQRALPNP